MQSLISSIEYDREKTYRAERQNKSFDKSVPGGITTLGMVLAAFQPLLLVHNMWVVQTLGKLCYIHSPESVPLRHESTPANCISDIVIINYYRGNPRAVLGSHKEEKAPWPFFTVCLKKFNIINTVTVNGLHKSCC